MPNENVDTFDNPAPVEPTATPVPAENTGGAAPDSEINLGLDTFDNPVDFEEPAKEEKEDKKDLETQTEQVGEVKTEPKEEPKKEDEPEPAKAEEESPEDSEAESETNSKLPPTKPLRGKLGEEKVEVDPRTEIKMKIDGRNTMVSIQDLRDNYAGKQSYEKRFQDLSNDRKEIEEERHFLEADRNRIQGHLTEIITKMDDPDADPLDALNYLLEITDRNPYDFNKRVFDHFQEEFEQLEDMSEAERELHWERKKLDSLRKSSESREHRQREHQAQEEVFRQVDELRDTHGVSEEQYVEAHDDLISLGYNEDSVTPEQVVRYAVFLPHVSRAEGLVTPFKDEIDDDAFGGIVKSIAQIFLDSSDVTDEDIVAELTNEYGEAATEIKQLNARVKEEERQQAKRPSKKNPYKKNEKAEDLEFFSDISHY